MSSTEALPSVMPGDPSWWFEEALSHEGHRSASPPLIGELRIDVVIVGGGFTGLWTAVQLKARAPHLTVALLEASLCGSGASGKNGGKVSGYWSALPSLVKSIGADAALAVARAGTRAQDGIRAFATTGGRDLWWREGPSIKISAAPAQDKKIGAYISEARRLGVSDSVQALSAQEVAGRVRSPVFRGGVMFTEGATVHPARLARALRAAAIEAGVQVYEHTPMVHLERGSPSRLTTPQGQVIAKEVVLATNAQLASDPQIRDHVSVFSSYVVMSNPAPDKLQELGWLGDEGLSDLRMFIHYFRKTADGRILMGSGSGPISYAGNAKAVSLTQDARSAARAERGLYRLFPSFQSVGLAKAWGGAIEVSSDRLPFFKTFPNTRVHYACGFSGHGVNPTYIAGQCLASLVLNQKDEWSSLPFCTRSLPNLPPDPFRTVGGRLVRWGIINCEEAEEQQRQIPLIARAAAKLPELLGMKIGTR